MHSFFKKIFYRIDIQTSEIKKTHSSLILSDAGVFGTVEMRPPTVGTWLVECTVGELQLAGMRAKLLVYNPGRCTLRRPCICWCYMFRMNLNGIIRLC